MALEVIAPDGAGAAGDRLRARLDEAGEGTWLAAFKVDDPSAAAKIAEGRQVAAGVRAMVVPGSGLVSAQAEEEGLDAIFRAAGFEWREPGCSMCLAMNPDKLQGRQMCASTSNRNFKGRQGSASGRTLLMSPAMAAAAAIEGKVADARAVFAMTGAAA